ncbi:MarR family winged helix-turn-helix transcriptional regulator [Chitinophaga vietnamensis]|uniref:MarR family winged helix-turn-helix transcriptional regulator n=1 Tax=Chitinophaga vietnamensis TaxID=2593957 RepID=UPI0011783D5F|nr:MarR family transcriptional regulator [Chitinophaga vietnamensis]
MAKRKSENAAAAYMQMMRLFMRVSAEWTNAAADSLGINATDLIAATYLVDAGPMTAGELAKVMDITTGAMTIAIDRLVQAGFAIRENDPQDRRKVIVKSLELPAKLLAMRKSIEKQLHKIFSHYTDAELLQMRTLTQQVTEVFEKEIFQLKRSQR